MASALSSGVLAAGSNFVRQIRSWAFSQKDSALLLPVSVTLAVSVVLFRCRPRRFVDQRLDLALGNLPLGILVSSSAICRSASLSRPW